MRNQLKSFLKLVMVISITMFTFSGCSGGSSSSSSSSNSNSPSTLGVLSFSQGVPSIISTTIQPGYSSQVNLNLSSKIGIAGVYVSLTSDNQSVAVIDSSNACFLSANANNGFPATCMVNIKGLSQGTTNIIASAPGFESAVIQAIVTTSAYAPGTIVFSPNPISVQNGQSGSVTLTLLGSTGINSESVTFTAQNGTGTINLSQNVCMLGTPTTLNPTANICTIGINATALGSASITAVSALSGVVTGNVNIVSTAVPGQLNVSTSLVQLTTNSQNQTPVLISLESSSGVGSVNVALASSGRAASVQPSNCILNQANNYSCSVTVVSNNNSGNGAITATASGYQVSTAYQVSTQPIPGYLEFIPAAESVSEHSSYSSLLYLHLANSQKVSGVTVNLSTSIPGVALQTTQCSLSSANPYCPISFVTGGGGNSGSIIASTTAAAYSTIAPNAMSVIGAGIIPSATFNYGPSGVITQISAAPNTQVNDIIVTIPTAPASGYTIQFVSESSGVVSGITPTNCKVNKNQNSCQISLNTGTSGSTLVDVIYNGQIIGALAIVISNVNNPGKLVVTPNTLMLPNNNSGFIYPVTVTLTGNNTSPESNYFVSFLPSDDTVVGVGKTSQYNGAFCCLNAESPSCTINVTTSSSSIAVQSASIKAYTVAESTTFESFCPNVAANNLAVGQTTIVTNFATPIPESRTITVINKCNYKVYPALSGGGFAAVSAGTCPTGATWNEALANCFWNNPSPNTVNGYTLAHGESTTFTIPATAGTSTNIQWSGGLAGRTGCSESGACQTGGCTGFADPSIGSGSLACVPTKGFSAPVTPVEFTFSTLTADFYDVTIINGITVPTSMASSNNQFINNKNYNPYFCGTAGSSESQNTTFAQSGQNMSLLAARWTPNIPSTITTPAVPSGTPASAFNYVSGSVATNVQGCFTDNDCIGKLSGPVCGYTFDSITQGYLIVGESYVFSCGQRLGYLTGAAIWAANPESVAGGVNTINFAPFGYESMDSGSLYANWALYNCPGHATSNPPGLNSPYAESTGSNAYACGGTNWGTWTSPAPQIATPAKPIVFDNPAWDSEVYPRIQWVKQACPTCYSYQYDDEASTFTCSNTTNLQNNPANNNSYTVTFCPDNLY